MKNKPQEKQKGKKFKKRVKRKHGKSTEPSKLATNLLSKNSNGTSNWDQLSKVIGYDINKPKMPSIPKKSTVKDTKYPCKMECNEVTSNGFTSKNISSISGTNSTMNKGARKPLARVSSAATSSSSNSNDISKDQSRFRLKDSCKKENVVVEANGKAPSSSSATFSDSVHSRRHTKYVAMDCEMVGTGQGGKDSMIARVSIVNMRGDCIYDTFVKPMEEITDFRTPISGVRPANLKNAKDLYTVQSEVTDILKGKILVGHALKNDFDCLFISHPKSMIRDTSKYKPFRQLFDGRTPSLKKLAEKLLGVEIQSGEHSSVEDAQAAMQVFLRHRQEWEKGLKRRWKRAGQKCNQTTENLIPADAV